MSSQKKVYKEGLIGTKIGMTQVYTDAGEAVPVTVIQLGPCTILEVKNKDKYGYSAVQLGIGEKKVQRCNKAEAGSFAKAGKGTFEYVREIRCDIEKLGWTTVGQEIKAGDVFKDGEIVDVSGTSIGRGFQGVVRKHGMKGQPYTRGTHEVRRHMGAVGCRKYPGRIFPGKRMPGHMGAERCTVQNLEVVRVRPEDNVILVRGGIPGHKGSLVTVIKASKIA
jgi:large subunit ribosomal protein L3